jgi:hypothetical protein
MRIPACCAAQERHTIFANSTSQGISRAMSEIGQGVQVVDATGEGVRLRPLADTLSDVCSGSGLRAPGSGPALGLRAQSDAVRSP